VTKKLMKIRISLFLIFLPPFPISSFGQLSEEETIVDDITKTKVYREGAYRTFDEFRRNSPSFDSLEVFAGGDLTPINPNLNNEYIVYVGFVDSLGNRGQITKKIWGFCKDNKIYVSPDYSPSLEGGFLGKFCRLRTIGRYCYFLKDTAPFPNIPIPRIDFYYVQQPTAKYLIPYVLNINNGQHYKLNEKTLNLILQTDSDFKELLGTADLKKDQGKYYYVIDMFNKRNKHQIKDIN
jgi:hypothetical protein